MMKKMSCRYIFVLLSIICFSGSISLGQDHESQNIAKGKPVLASSESEKYPASNAVNGIVSRESKWMSLPGAHPPHVLEIDLQKYYHVNRIIIHSGIPEGERTPEESLQAAGFWAVKHFRLQYWDDANWTDIPRSEVTENRQTSFVLDFAPAFLTFKIRFIAMDGEPVNVMEIEVFGEDAPGLPVPSPVASAVTEFDSKTDISQAIDVAVLPRTVGKSMKYVAYNQAYFLPGSNVKGWLEYSQVNSLRVWTTLSTYAPVSAVQTDLSIASLAEFEKRKMELRANPENDRFIDWGSLIKIYTEPDYSSTNAMRFDYVLEEAKKLGIEIMLQVGERRFDEDWAHQWQQWQRYYALAYYAAREGDVTMFAKQNEPNHAHSGPMTIETWLRGMRLASDAVRCAIQDVNKKYGKNLVPRFVGPVTAGTNVDWWAEVVRNIRIDYRGNTIDYDLIDIFSTHSYNSPAAGYATRVKGIRKIIRDNHPAGKEIPVVFTEIGRWMNAYLIDKEETMDSPSLFTEWAGIYTNNMLNGGYGMWAFKFASNTTSTYPRGIKSGHHFTWNGKRIVEDAYVNLAGGKPVATNSPNEDGIQRLTDGAISDHSSWTCNYSLPEKWVEIDFLKDELIGSAMVYSGSAYGVFTGPDRLRNFKLQYLDGREWRDIPGATESNCKYVQVLLEFERPVKTRKIRLLTTEEGTIKLREVKLFEYKKGPETAPESYDISGIHRTGEVVRLFAKGFKNERDLLQTNVSTDYPYLDVCTSYDDLTGQYYMWLVQRASYDVQFNIDLSALGVLSGHPVIAEVVGPRHYGEVVHVVKTSPDGKFTITLPAQSVMLVSIPPAGGLDEVTEIPVSDAMVSGGRNARKNFGNSRELKVSLDASNPDNNKVAYIHFDRSNTEEDTQLSLLGLNGYVDKGAEPLRIHVYAFADNFWNEKRLNWRNSPHLDTREAWIRNVGDGVSIVGQLAFDNEERYHYLDVTRIVNKYRGGVTFVLVRETRHMGDYGDKGRNVVISSRETDKKPILINYSGSIESEPRSRADVQGVKDMEIFLLIGQSNMAGRAEIEERDKNAIENVFLYTGIPGRKWEAATNPLNKYSTVRKELEMQKLSPGYTFAKSMASFMPGKKLGLVVNARGGTAIEEWMPGKELYNEALIQAREASRYGNLRGVVWHQGESDVSRTDSYLEKVAVMINSLREDLNIPNLPFVAGQVSEDRPERSVFNSMILHLPEAVPCTGVVTSEGTSTFDKTHFDTESQRKMGERYASEMLRIINEN
jgi:hypothetical protein